MNLLPKREKLQAISQRARDVAEAWYEAISAVADVPFSPDEVLQLLEESSRQLIILLQADPFDAEPAWEIGRSLADIHLLRPEVLLKTQEVLAEALTWEQPADRGVPLQSRTVALLGQLATGFFSRARDIMLAEQEAIRRAHVTAQTHLAAAVRRSEEKYRTLVESARQAIFIVSRKGMVQFMNGSAASELGGKPQDHVGKSMWDLFPQDVADGHMAAVIKVLDTGRAEIRESQTVLQGKPRWRETSLQPLKSFAGEYNAVLGVSTDITERKLAEAASRRFMDRLAVLHEIDRGILAARSPEAIAQAALKHAQRLIPSWGAAVIMFDPDEEEFVLLAGRVGNFKTGNRYPIVQRGVVDRLREGEPVVADDIRSTQLHAAEWQHIIELGGRSLLSIPLKVRGAVIGAFAAVSERPAAYSEEHVEVAYQISTSLAIGIQDAKLLEAERAARNENLKLIKQIRHHAKELEGRVEERTQELSALYEITAIAGSYLDLGETLDHSLAKALEVLHCQGGAIYLSKEDGAGVELAVSSGFAGPSTAQADFPDRYQARAANVLQQGKLTIELVGEARTADRDESTSSFMSVAVPMKARGRAIGVVVVQAESSRRFTPGEVSLMSAMADHMATAVENARLQQKAERVAVMEERQRLARELHDSVTQQLYSLRLFADAARERMDDGKTDLVQKHLEDIESTAQHALKEMRLMLFELRTNALDEGLVEALRHRIEAVEARVGVATRFTTGTLPRLSESAEEGLFRIALEALNNALKHTNATEISIALRADLDVVFLEVTDNGDGFDPEVAFEQGGMGLKIMRERTEKLNGKLAISSEPGQGTRVCVAINKDGTSISDG